MVPVSAFYQQDWLQHPDQFKGCFLFEGHNGINAFQCRHDDPAINDIIDGTRGAFEFSDALVAVKRNNQAVARGPGRCQQ